MGNLATDVEEMRDELRELNDKWTTAEPVSRAAWKKTIAIALVITSMGLTWEHVTLTKCFLTPAQTGWNRNLCALIYPGYEKSRQQSEKNLENFRQVILDAKTNGQRIAEIEKKLENE